MLGERLERDTATEWATWFAALGDPTRVLILNLLATNGGPMTVAEVTDGLDVGQSTVSHHLAKLAEVGFVLVERVGTSSRWQVNTSCLDRFPSAAEMVMGRVDIDLDLDPDLDGAAAAGAGAASSCAPGPAIDPETGRALQVEVRAYYRAAAERGSSEALCDDDRWGTARYDDETANQAGAAAELSMGCGNPFALADLRPGERVLDLGSRGGIDVILSARRVAPDGMAYGIDFLDEMVELGRANAREAGVDNVEFLLGPIEHVPLPDDSVDVVISNCVINLAPDKRPVFAEMARVLRPGGRVAVSDVVAENGFEPPTDGRAWAECGAGALQLDEYRALLADRGLVDISIELTHEVGPGLHAAAVRAHTPS